MPSVVTVPSSASPIGIAIYMSLIVFTYLLLMSINSYVPAVLLLSGFVGYTFYNLQQQCYKKQP
jgi:hypothetical protein